MSKRAAGVWMRVRQALDLSIILCEITGIILVHNMSGDDLKKATIIAVMAGLAIFFTILFGKDSLRYRRSDSEWAANGKITQIILLSEEKTEIASWDIYGKTSVTFGRDQKGQQISMEHNTALEPKISRGVQIDIDLSNTVFAASVDPEHAVMNYTNGGWYLEDLESENGVRIQRSGEINKYRIAPGMPCLIGSEDVIHLGLAQLKVR